MPKKPAASSPTAEVLGELQWRGDEAESRKYAGDQPVNPAPHAHSPPPAAVKSAPAAEQPIERPIPSPKRDSKKRWETGDSPTEPKSPATVQDLSVQPRMIKRPAPRDSQTINPTDMQYGILQHVPGGPADAETARVMLLESQFELVIDVHEAATKQGIVPSVVVVMDHQDARARRIANLTRPVNQDGESMARETRGRLGAMVSEVAAFPVWKTCEIIGDATLNHLHDLVMADTSPPEFVVIVIGFAGATGFRIGAVTARGSS